MSAVRPLTDDELLALGRDDLALYSKALWPKFELPPHLALLVGRLEAVASGRIRRLVVSMPPRHGKSFLCSQLFPAWKLGRNPEASVAVATYSAELAEDFGRKARNFVADPRHRAIFPQSRMRDDSAAADRFNLRAGGSAVFVGRGGSLTGRGADVLIGDDLLKDNEEAQSPTIRRKLHDWFKTVAFTRLEPEGAIVLVTTRWHLDDLVGYLLREHAEENWDVLNLPALSEGKNDPLGRAEGKALWPERFPVEDLHRTRSLIGSMSFAALYQGRPVALEGSIFRLGWFQRYREMPERFERVLLSADTAFKEGQENDYSVVTVWGTTQNAIYLLSVWRQRVGFPDLKRAIVSLAEHWKPQAVLIEDRASGQSLIQALKSETRLPVIPVKADASKTSRAQAAAPMVEAGKVFLPESAPWLTEFLDEILSFPAFSHDDQVDSTTMALNWMRTPQEPGLISYYHRLAHEAQHERGEFPDDRCDDGDCPRRSAA